MVSFAIDTSALVSIGHTNLCDVVADNFDLIVTPKIIQELTDISSFKDDDSLAARKWLDLIERLQVREVEPEKTGEEELSRICANGQMILVTDDIKAIRKFGDEIKCFFSIHLIYILMKKGIVSVDEAISSLEKMRKSRDWRSNIIAATARSLLMESDEGVRSKLSSSLIHKRAEEYAYQEMVKGLHRGMEKKE